jgi:hypothetical protein
MSRTSTKAASVQYKLIEQFALKTLFLHWKGKGNMQMWVDSG